MAGVRIGVGNAERVCIHKTCAITVDSEAQRYGAAVKDLREFLQGGFGVDVPVAHNCSRAGLAGTEEISLTLSPEMRGPAPGEGYRLAVSSKPQGPQVRLVAGSSAGLLYGVQELKLRSRFENGALEAPGLDISSFPALAIRGIKGLRWNPSDYLSIIDFLTACRFNFLMLCYGMVPEHCRQWRKPYSEEHLQAISEIVRRCEERFIRVCVAVNPSLRSEPPICYSGKQDLELLIQKFRASYDLGVRTFALALVVKQLKPNVAFSASLMPEGALADSRTFALCHYAQRYCDAELYDFICPMAYHADYGKTPAWVGTVTQGAIAESSGKPRVYAGIQAYGKVTSQDLADAVQAARLSGADGVVLFRYGEISVEEWSAVDETLGSRPMDAIR